MHLLLALLLPAAFANDPDPAAEPPAATAEAAPEATEATTEAAPTEGGAEATDAEGEAADEEPEPEPEPAKPRLPGTPEPGSKHYDLEEQYASKDYFAGKKLAEERLAANPDDPALYWLTARFYYETGELMDKNDPNTDKEAHYAKMVEISEKGLEKDPNNIHTRFARGIGNGRLGTTRGVLSSLWLASSVEQDWLAVANSDFRYASLDENEILPCDAQYALGIFYRLVPDAWIVKVLSGTRGSLDKSLQYHQMANSCAPGRMHVAKEMGVTQLCIGTKRKDAAVLDAGKDSLRKVLSMAANTEKEKIDKRHAQMLIDNPALACGYSRDGQQEVDEAKLEK